MGSWVLVHLPSSLCTDLESIYSVGVFRAEVLRRRGHFCFCLPP